MPKLPQIPPAVRSPLPMTWAKPQKSIKYFAAKENQDLGVVKVLQVEEKLRGTQCRESLTGKVDGV